MQAVWKLAPALATGNSLILKPSEHSSLTCLYLGELLKDVIPKGVLQVISGDGAIGKYLGELELDGVNFTGSS
jgi:acyl-CoA reductase-like NAD-dependent aldehyde dehydrogenase